jgi:mannose-6-phosphate isomerase
MKLYPLTFRPILKERVWGGRKLGEIYGKSLPPNVPIGESWEISDRSADVSCISNGPLAGKDFHWLVQHHTKALMGEAKLQAGRFPLLIKLLDCKEKLSLQVHPPPAKAAQFGGEAKTELWYVADAQPGAELYVGLKRGVTPQLFEQRIQAGTVADCFHRVKVRDGDAMFLPSGRLHAIGGGLVIFEIQQNSDTTYRVFDWNRVGLDGKPRELHIAESLASIDFNDFEPELVCGESHKFDGIEVRELVDHHLFSVQALSAPKGNTVTLDKPRLRILGLVEGRLTVRSGAEAVNLTRGQFCLLPACLESIEILFAERTSLLLVEPGIG